MNKEARQQFNSSFSKEKYEDLIADINREFPGQLDFRVAESPIFVSKEMKIKLLTACNDIISEINKPDFLEKTKRAIPVDKFVPNENEKPDFLAIDFAVCKNNDGELEPQLIELQGFPSLFAYQSYLSSKYKKHFSVNKNFEPYFNRLNTAGFLDKMKSFLLGDTPSENVILLEIFPEKQKTRFDFTLTKVYWGIETVCITKIKKRGRSLFYIKDGIEIKIEKIYNRLIFDDLDRNYSDIKLDFDLKDDLDIVWLSHPNWFYRVSKFSLPLFKSIYIPESNYLSELKEIPEDLENYVLKPLFSFAGAGVKIDLTPSDISEIKDPENYLLQKKIQYDPCIIDTNGEGIKAEIRMLYIWPKNAKTPFLITNLTRLSRGKMIGVDYNKDFDWVGGSAGFFEKN